MLKPVTEEERLEFTLRIQASKGTDELLNDLLDKNYNGFVDIWPEIKKVKKEVVLTIKYDKVKLSSEPLSNENAVRYHIFPGKGVKIIK
jgi:hypothetical protein